jgi:hypothetical protein
MVGENDGKKPTGYLISIGTPLTDLPFRHPYKAICSGVACTAVVVGCDILLFVASVLFVVSIVLLISFSGGFVVGSVGLGVSVVMSESFVICKLNSSRGLLSPCRARIVVCTSRNIVLPIKVIFSAIIFEAGKNVLCSHVARAV